MHLFKRFIFLLLLVFTTLRITAATFTVTSNADSGPGTLRDAITQANANGIATQDFIYFNLPIATWADRTIILNTDLPLLTGNITIDASTQPGIRLGVSDAKVIITLNPAPQPNRPYYALRIKSASNIEIFGLALKHSLSHWASGYGIVMEDVTNVTIGGPPGKGNLINGFISGILQDKGLANNIVIQRNIMGVEEDGVTISANDKENKASVELSKVTNVRFGGDPATGNLVVSGDIKIDISGTLDFSFNRVGVDNTSNNAPRVVAFQTGSNFATDLKISDNHFGGATIYVYYLLCKFFIQRNKIGTDASGINAIPLTGPRPEVGIQITNCDKLGMISDNMISGYSIAGISLLYSTAVTISQNQMFCNAKGIHLDWNPASIGRPAPFANIIGCTPTGISGVSVPNAKIELFESYDCTTFFPQAQCQGRRYINTVSANAAGNWSYTGATNIDYIATATDQSGATSEYSTPKLDYTNFVITNPSCNKSNGQIVGKILQGNFLHWKNAAGNIVGTDLTLKNVPAGDYFLWATSSGCSTNGCASSSTPIKLIDQSPTLDASNVKVNQTTCSQKDGSITDIVTTGQSLTYAWKNAGGTVVTTTKDLTAAGPGSYTFEVTDINGCILTAGPYVLQNISGPTLDRSTATLTPSLCSKTNGSITGVKVNGTGTIDYTWTDINNATVGTQADLFNVAGGKYVLKFKDASACPQAISDTFVIVNQGGTLKIKLLTTMPAHCNQANGAIKNLEITGGTTIAYRWMDKNNQLVSNDPTPANLAPGNYTLYATDAGGCEQLLITADINEIAAPKLDDSKIKITPDQCSIGTGSITNITVTGTAPFTYTWYHNNTSVGQSIALSAIKTGNYYLDVKDNYGCTVSSDVYNVPNNERLLSAPEVPGTTIVKGMDANLQVQNPQTGTYHLYLANAPNTAISSSTTGSFQLKGILVNTTFYVKYQQGNCESPFVEVLVKVVDDVKVLAPTAFTPNGDGKNDLFRVKAYGLAKMDYFSVFNRWGTTVFSTQDPQTGWNGKLNGIPQSGGSYIWIIKGVDIKGNSIQKSGSVILLK